MPVGCQLNRLLEDSLSEGCQASWGCRRCTWWPTSEVWHLVTIASPVSVTEASLSRFCKLSVYFFLGDVVAGVCVVVTDDFELFIQRPRQILLAAVEGQLVNSYFACVPIGSEISNYENPLMRRKSINKGHTYISRYSTREPQHSSPPPHSLVILSMEAWSLQKGIPPPPEWALGMQSSSGFWNL